MPSIVVVAVVHNKIRLYHHTIITFLHENYAVALFDVVSLSYERKGYFSIERTDQFIPHSLALIKEVYLISQ